MSRISSESSNYDQEDGWDTDFADKSSRNSVINSVFLSIDIRVKIRTGVTNST